MNHRSVRQNVSLREIGTVTAHDGYRFCDVDVTAIKHAVVISLCHHDDRARRSFVQGFLQVLVRSGFAAVVAVVAVIATYINGLSVARHNSLVCRSDIASRGFGRFVR